jgi:hypothetical protein
MSQDPIMPANEKMAVVYQFFERNKTIFTIIAVFAALAGFLYSFNKTTFDENIVFGILFLVFLIGLLLTLILYDVIIILFALIGQKNPNFFTVFQIFFIGTFTMFLLMFFESLLEYLYSQYTDWLIWLGIATFMYFMMAIGAWSNDFILKKIGNSKKILLLTILCYSIILILILIQIFSLLMSVKPQSSSIINSHIAQMIFFMGIFLIYLINSVLYFGGTLIKRFFTSDKTP